MSAACLIRGLGIYLPQQRHSAEYIAQRSGLPPEVVRDKLGISAKCVPGPDDHTAAMGIRAARLALDEARLPAERVDVLISINEEHKEYPLWTAGIYTAQQLGATGAYAFDIGQKCGTAVLGLKLAQDLLRSDPQVGHVLVAGGYRNGDLIDYRDADTRFLYNLAAGGGAALVTRGAFAAGGTGFELLGSAFRTDGSFAEDVIVPVGGTRRPLTPDNVAEYRFRVPDPAAMKQRLERKSLDNFVEVIRQACARSGLDDPARIDYLALLHMKRSAHEAILQRLGLPQERSIYLSDYGHVGQVDPLLSLQLARQRGLLHDGALCVLAAAGIGYVWNALGVRYREQA